MRYIAPNCGITLQTFMPSIDILRKSFSNPSAPKKKHISRLHWKQTNVGQCKKSEHCVSPSNGRGKSRGIARRDYSLQPCTAEIKHASLTAYQQSEVSDAWWIEKAVMSKIAETARRLCVLSLGSHTKRCCWSGNGKHTGRIITLRRLNSSGNAERENCALCEIRILQPG